VDQREYFNDHNSRIVFNHDITYDTNTSYDIDTDLNYLQIHESNQHRNILRPSMAKAKWDSLSQDEKTQWDKFSPQSKAVILGISKPLLTTPTTLNLHNISATDYLQLTHNSYQTVS
jgi:hypothetical protein